MRRVLQEGRLDIAKDVPLAEGFGLAVNENGSFRGGFGTVGQKQNLVIFELVGAGGLHQEAPRLAMGLLCFGIIR